MKPLIRKSPPKRIEKNSVKVTRFYAVFCESMYRNNPPGSTGGKKSYYDYKFIFTVIISKDFDLNERRLPSISFH